MADMLLTLLIVAVMPYLAKAPLVWAMQQAGGYDNHYPRRQQALLKDFGERCTAAHYNSFEALGLYIAAIVFVVAAGNVTSSMLIAAWLFVVCRLGYLLCYWLNWAAARSLIWLGSVAAAISLMLMALAELP
ncbi:MAPEG family protein [Alishewanella sp. 16-MA]|uniref:MAPEG family protein n=1 Tax=Alishewanella maricola TaxID=2795740 RepID=A0ABS8C404_9ALTE|nr:MAPEG family protein [Alishewanella maricola]MCB5227017.1 MAPEG family protein [Alishewanella maricola]MDP4944561.1 MAPEG family protein [Alishewanella sp.]MDP5036199.1 MAPEG family protein [Alishewanella sp.]MDP5185646.1 MAPEG family protein [Alishewanella sp.]